ncbi:hypothetical protein ACP275_02G172200 [Erythranthe tilingii]
MSNVAPCKCSFCEAKGSELPDIITSKYDISGLVSDCFNFHKPKGKLLAHGRFLLEDPKTIRKMVYKDCAKIHLLEFCVKSFDIRVPLDRISGPESSYDDGYVLLNDEMLNSYLVRHNVNIA